MDFLLTEGYAAAAETFAEEAPSFEPFQAPYYVNLREDIRTDIFSGRVEEARSHALDWNVTFVYQDPLVELLFQRQQLFELLRAGKEDEALVYAQENMGPFLYKHAIDAETGQVREDAKSKEMNEIFEQTMAIFAFDPTQKPANEAAKTVLEMIGDLEKVKTARRLNELAMEVDKQRGKGKIDDMIKWATWLQKELKERNIPVVELRDPMIGVIYDEPMADVQDTMT